MLIVFASGVVCVFTMLKKLVPALFLLNFGCDPEPTDNEERSATTGASTGGETDSRHENASTDASSSDAPCSSSPDLPPEEMDPCERLQECLDGSTDPCADYGECTMANRALGTVCHPTCNGQPCVDVCSGNEPDCVASWECMWECPAICEDPATPPEDMCVYQCWDLGGDCQGLICYIEVGCEVGECP